MFTNNTNFHTSTKIFGNEKWHRMQLVKSRGFKNMFQICDSKLEWLLGAIIGADAEENNQVLKLMFSYLSIVPNSPRAPL